MSEQNGETRGFVFAATGEVYATLARRAARSLRQVDPNAEIDLFTNMGFEDPVFSKIHRLDDDYHRPKIEALLNTRFDRTIYLDADTMVVAPLDPAFDVLDRFDLAAAQDRYLNNQYGRRVHGQPVPSAFPTLNSGLVAIRRCDATQRFLQDWLTEMKTSGSDRDQPPMRTLLYTGDLRICALPPGYNLLTHHELKTWWGMFGAPRMLHCSFLHQRRGGPGDPETPFEVRELLGPLNARRLRALMKADVELTPDVPLLERTLNGPLEPTPVRWLRHNLRPIYHRLFRRKT